MSGIDLDDLRRTGGIIRLSGKEFVTFSGLLITAHSNGLESIDTTMLSWDHAATAAVFRATVTGERGTFSAHGDADPSNVKRGMVGAALRMAETRAVCRALRMYLGIGMTAREELPGDGPARPRVSTPSPAFLDALRRVGVEYPAVQAECAARGWGDPAAWTDSARRAFVADLRAGGIPALHTPAQEVET